MKISSFKFFGFALFKVLVVAILMISSGAQAATKKIGILAFDKVLSSDITAPLEVFGAAVSQSWFSDYEVVLINVEDNYSITTNEGFKIHVDTYLSEDPDVDVLIVPSAYDMSPFINNKKLIKYVKKIAKKDSWMASNCSGSEILAASGILDGKKATTWAGGEQDFAKSFPSVDVQNDVNYVVDGKVITSNGSVVSYQSALVLLEKLSNADRAKEISDTIQFGRLSKI